MLMGIGDVQSRLEGLAASSKVSGTFFKDGKIITCAGFVEMWPGVAEMWQLPTIHVPKHYIEYARCMKQYVDTIAKTFGYHRLQTTCPEDALHNRWMTFLGFKKEGTMPKYTFNKLDYSIFGRIYGD